jgi:hypothetical protein
MERRKTKTSVYENNLEEAETAQAKEESANKSW